MTLVPNETCLGVKDEQLTGKSGPGINYFEYGSTANRQCSILQQPPSGSTSILMKISDKTS